MSRSSVGAYLSYTGTPAFRDGRGLAAPIVARPHAGITSMRLTTFLYYCSFALFLFGNCIASTTIEGTADFKLGCQIIAIIFLVGKLCFDRFGARQLLLFLPITAVFAYSGYVSSDFALLWSWLFIVTGSGADIKRLAKVALCVFLVTLVLTVCLSLGGAIENIVMTRTGTGGLRYALGFRHPNGLGRQILEVAIALLIIRYPRFRFTDYLICCLAFLAIWQLTDSRTSMICLLFAVLVCAFVSGGFVRKHEKGVLWFALILFGVEVMLSVATMFINPHGSAVASALNQLLSDRPYYDNYYFTNYGVRLFGQNLESIVSIAGSGYSFDGYVIDNAYCHMLLINGLVPFLVMIGLIGLCYVRMIKEGRFTALAMAFVLFTFLGVTESSAINFYTAYYLIGLCPLFFGRPLSSACSDGQSSSRHSSIHLRKRES